MIEIITTNMMEAKIIEKCGADRIELISAFSEGGLTPSYAVIESTIKSTKLPVNVMIRPHSNSFVYAGFEIENMKKDIDIVKSLGANGVVFGVLNENHEIDEDKLKTLLEVCDTLDVTFHKAIDRTPNIKKAIKTLAKYPQVTTVLTAGGMGNIEENLEILKEIIKMPTHLEILLGGGLTLANVENIKAKTSAKSFHFGTCVRTPNSHNGNIDEEKLKQLIKLLK